jgi:predicted nucleic acid-binding protein
VQAFLADTSVLVAEEVGRPLPDPPPGILRLSVATLTELVVGVQRAGDPRTRRVREATLAQARRFIAIPYDEHVAHELGLLLAAARSAGRRAGLMDAIIAATALVHDLTVWTQDDDFAVLAELAPALRVHRG